MTRRFEATERTTLADLKRTIQKMGATGLRVTQDYDAGTVEIVFDRDGRRYVVRNNHYNNPLDNLRAAQLTITYLYQALETYGTQRTVQQGAIDAFAKLFLPFEATPDDTVLLLGSGQSAWWTVLGVSETATAEEVRNAFRALAKTHHPDVGGSAEEFKRLRLAYDAGLAARGGG